MKLLASKIKGIRVICVCALYFRFFFWGGEGTIAQVCMRMSMPVGIMGKKAMFLTFGLHFTNTFE